MGCVTYADVVSPDLPASIRACTAAGCAELEAQAARARVEGARRGITERRPRRSAKVRRAIAAGVYEHHRLPMLLTMKLSRAMRTMAQKPIE